VKKRRAIIHENTRSISFFEPGRLQKIGKIQNRVEEGGNILPSERKKKIGFKNQEAIDVFNGNGRGQKEGGGGKPPLAPKSDKILLIYR